MRWPLEWRQDREDRPVETSRLLEIIAAQTRMSRPEIEHQCFLVDGLIRWLDRHLFSSALAAEKPPVLALSGGQGTGKSTLARHLALALRSRGQTAELIGLDDFYLPQKDRIRLAREIHPLLMTRGVPGTHDLAMLVDVIRGLRSSRQVAIPVFDKLKDDRLPEARFSLPGAQILILEGWCLGARVEAESGLTEAVNDLEKSEDPDLIWRHYVNQQMESEAWMSLDDLIDQIIFFRIPSFDQVLAWRWQQEQELAAKAGTARGMDRNQIKRFISHFERITLSMLENPPEKTALEFNLNEHHKVIEIRSFLPNR